MEPYNLKDGLDVSHGTVYSKRRTELLTLNRIIKKTDWTSDMEPYNLKDGLDL